MLTRYCLGFLFNKSGTQVVLLRKERPEWQKGFFNGIGGKVGDIEHPNTAMKREAQEEINFSSGEWDHFCVMSGSQHTDGKTVYPFIVNCYKCFADIEDLKDVVKQMEDELLVIVDVRALPKECLSNLFWLIPMALDNNIGYRVEVE